ncbi:AAA family ATPase [Enterobacteriaceae bacterium H20N1]|uniref:AAA family ATPase n=1 Tax=Dryocola boscaweniae TaxID=2925397 RepID=A0A9X2WAP2_9ENTR|nr:AAA family ATPase [Dryocola boscaweniae]MCT4703228.1 AAA family ATPase [Dryocola boscaweniae]MCT4720396.1 AAA family ATPase [Dryocola boscaweniae]
MKSIVFFNNKGGVGKTTLLCNVASLFALEYSKKVLVVDTDPQCNTTTYCMGEEEIEKIFSKVKRETIEVFFEPLKKGKGVLDAPITPLKSKRFGFDLISGDPKLSLSEDLLASDWKSAISGDARGLQTNFVIKDLLLKYENDYDFIFFDVGPSLGALNRSILISSDFYIVPMSVDLFSLSAIENISISLNKWKSSISRSLEIHEEEEGEKFTISGTEIEWTLKFLGYAVQQYTAKTVGGSKRPVRAYEKINKKIPSLIEKYLVGTSVNDINDFKLGEIQNLHSLVPLSQSANCPIFKLKSSDGVVGAHFSMVKDAKEIFDSIARNIIKQMEVV